MSGCGVPLFFWSWGRTVIFFFYLSHDKDMAAWLRGHMDTWTHRRFAQPLASDLSELLLLLKRHYFETGKWVYSNQP